VQDDSGPQPAINFYRARVAQFRAERDRHAVTMRRLACERECAAAAFDRASYALADANLELDRALQRINSGAPAHDPAQA
jgi:hypothetical protein